METSEEEHGCFFRDNKRRADYALAINKGTKPLVFYISSLEKLGLEFEINRKPKEERFFIVIHIPQTYLETYSRIYDIGIEISRFNFDDGTRFSECFKTNIKVPPKNKGEFTSAERIMIIEKLLERARFGLDPDEFGIEKLLKSRVIEQAYPLHDGPTHRSSNKNTENDRRLLYLHWARFRCWYKDVPIDLVQKYFGCEIAFYFAWLEFFNKMLLPAAIVGLLMFVVNSVMANLSVSNPIEEVCNQHQMYICPICAFPSHCTYKKLSDFCFMAKGVHLFDNYLTVVFAIFMSFWATIFRNLWKRKENILKMKWGVYVDNEEIEIRHEYIDALKRYNIKRNPGGLEPFLPRRASITHMVASVTVCVCLVLLVLGAVFLVIVYKILVKAECNLGRSEFLKEHSLSVAAITGSMIQVIFIKMFGKVYGKLSIRLTAFENPRTKHDFDNSVLYKRYFLAFVNNYAPLFYLAFMRGRFYDIPHKKTTVGILASDTCQPINCVFSLAIQLGFLMVFKRLAGNILTIIILGYKRMSKKSKKETASKIDELPQYEADFELLPTNRYLLTTEFCEMIIEFGFVTLFVAAFPLAPLCSFLNNILEHRLDAMKLVTDYRRPSPRKTSGIGAWDGILLGVTYLSTATSAFVIAFTSDFVLKEVYTSYYDTTSVGYVNFTLSEFNTSDFNFLRKMLPEPLICNYKGNRYPPDHPLRYELGYEHWVNLTVRLICVLAFEHVILLLNGILSYAIPDIPKSVKEQINLDRERVKQAKLVILSKTDATEKGESGEDNQWIVV